MVPEFIMYRLEARFGDNISYPKDCNLLAAEMSRLFPNVIVSGTTLKRLFGIKNHHVKPHKYTMDAVARYAGYKDWAMDEESILGNTYFPTGKKIIIGKLKENQTVTVTCQQGTDMHMDYLGNYNFRITDLKNCTLTNGDILHILRLETQYPILCENITRDGKPHGKFRGSRKNVITGLDVAPLVKTAEIV